METIEKLQQVYGNTKTLITPSGYQITIREQNGEDDEILSNEANSMDGTSTSRFIQSIIIDSDISPKGRLSIDEVKNLKLCDKYFIILASRIFSIGQIVKFSYTWPDELEVDYDEDLGQYIWDYSKDKSLFPTKTDPEYFKYRIKPHNFGKEPIRNLKLTSGKELRYTFLNINGEKWLMSISEENTTVNTELYARSLEMLVGDKWIRVQNFKTFSTDDMRELRKDVLENDPNITLFSELEHPITHKKIKYPIVGTPDFFYPREI